jgi:hypothetical protein
MTADAEVVKDKRGKWYVNYWLPEKFHGPPALSAAQKMAQRKAAKAAAAAAAKRPKSRRVAAPSTPNPDAARARGLWWAVPIGIVALIIFGPFVAMLVIWLRNKREQRRVMRSA